MIEMLDVNSLNETTTIATVFENNQTIHNNNNSYDASPLSDTGSQQHAMDATSATAILSDVIMNTTAIVVDYATQWLTSTIATTAANMTTISENTTAIITNSSNSTTTTNNNASDSSALYAAVAATATTTMSSISNSIIDIYNYGNISLNGCPNPIADLTMTNPNGEILHACHPENPNFNCTIEDYMLYVLGPKTLPIHKALLVTIIYGGIFITGILGNILICVVIVRHQAMHTATNYYLFSLAVSDLIFLLFGLPTEVFMYWHQYPYLFGLPFCKVRAYISEACSYVSVFTIVAFSVERYLAICHPLHLYAMSGFKRALRIIALLWVISFLGAIPFGMLTEIMYLYVPKEGIQIDESAFCVMFPEPELYVFEISFVVFFLIPMLLIFFFYGRMGAKIRSRTTQQLGVQQGSMHRESRHQQSRKAVIRMLAAVVLTFFICWLPFHAQRLFYVYGKCYKYYNEVNEVLFSITGFAYYVSCTVNPILYNVMSHRYRVAFKDTLCGKRKSVYYNNGFARDQSSFRETTVASSLGNTGVYDRGYGRSFRVTNNIKDRTSIKSNNISWKKAEFCTPLEKDIPENHTVVNTLNTGTNVVVCVDNGVNGRTKVFTENEAQESLLSKNDETCI